MKRGLTVTVKPVSVSCSQMPGMLAWLFCARIEALVILSMGVGWLVERSTSRSQ
jgi:hypothetical protein